MKRRDFTIGSVLILVFCLATPGFMTASADWKRVAQSEALADLEIRGITGLAVGKDGSVYLLDSNRRRVTRLDPRLRKINAFGGPGEGPGEFNRPFSIGIHGEGEIVVTDAHKKFTLFDSRGRLVREIRMPPGCHVIEGYLLDYPLAIGTKMNTAHPRAGYNAILFHLEEGKVLAEYPLRFSPLAGIRTRQGGFMAPSLPGVGGHCWIEARGGLCLLGEGERWDVRLVAVTGEYRARVCKELPADELTPKEWDYLVKKIEKRFPGMFAGTDIRRAVKHYQTRNPVYGLRMDTDRFYVFLGPADLTRDDITTAEVYDLEGKHQGSLDFPKIPLHMNRGIAYWIETREGDGETTRHLCKVRIPDQ